MNVGIMARWQRAFEYWQQHVTLSKHFINSSLNEDLNTKPTVVILGAGRLIDIDCRTLIERAKCVHLFDIDPSLEPLWQKELSDLKKTNSLYCHFMDLSNSMAIWTKKVHLFLKKKPSAHQFGELLAELKPESIFLGDFYQRPVHLVSLNILGQLGVFWRDRIFEMCHSKYPGFFKSHGTFVDVIESGLQNSIRELEMQHLEICLQLAPEKLILITDLYYHFYRQTESEWQTHDALAVGTEKEVLELLAKDKMYSVSAKQSWLWHIAPQGVEEAEYGEIHEVGAFSLSLQTT